MGICALVIWYNPDKKMVKNINSYSKSLEKVYIIDNSENNNQFLLNGLKDVGKIFYFPNYKNYGIAKALNIGFSIAYKNGFKWVLTMDQDSSFVKEGFLILLKSLSLLRENNRLGILCPRRKEDLFNERYEEKKAVIASGNLVNICAYNEIFGFMEGLFIDEVDHEFCYRLKKAGYSIIRDNNVLLNHKLGETIEINFFGIKFKTFNHSYERKYYIFRNRMYIRKLYPEIGKNYFLFNIRDLIFIMLVEKDKFRKMKFAFKGLLDYKNRKMGEKK